MQEIKRYNNPKKMQAIDLFCGVGGLTYGLRKTGIDVTLGIDIDPECRYAYVQNNNVEMILADLKNLDSDKLASFYQPEAIRLLAGCAPCQPFSTYSRKSRKSKPDLKWDLVSVFAKKIQELNPELVTMENVPQLADHQVFEEFLDSLSNYEIDWHITDCSGYGVPQTRKRLVLLASRLGNVRLLTPKELNYRKMKVRDVIKHLRPISAGQTDQDDPLHTSSRLSDLNMQRIRASKPGGTWRDWPPKLLAACHRKTTGQTYPSVYGRMMWDEPSPTITTQCFGYGNGRFGHPNQDRAISLREAALLQTFPEHYQFMPPGKRAVFKVHGRLIGNAVPVRLGEVIGKSLNAHVTQIFGDTST